MARGVLGPATDARLLRDATTLASLHKLGLADGSVTTFEGVDA